MKKLFIFVLIIMMSSNIFLYSQRILVLPFDTYNADFFALMPALFALELNSRCKYDVVILDNYGIYTSRDIGNSKIIDTEYIKMVALENEADYVVIGSVYRNDNLKINVSADLINIKDFSIVGSGYVEYLNIDDVINSVPLIVDKILDYKGVATYLDEKGYNTDGAKEIRKLLKVYINARNKSGETAIMIASFYGYADVVSKLIEEGADTEYTRNDGLNALMLAARQNNVDVVRVLLDNYADVTVKSLNGFNVLSHAAYMGSFDVMKLLIEERYFAYNVEIDSAQKLKSIDLYRAMNIADNRGYTRLSQYIFETLRKRVQDNK